MTEYDIQIPTMLTHMTGQKVKCAECGKEAHSGSMMKVRVNQEPRVFICTIWCLEFFFQNRRKQDAKQTPPEA
jgi:hypothetical protein